MEISASDTYRLIERLRAQCVPIEKCSVEPSSVAFSDLSLDPQYAPDFPPLRTDVFPDEIGHVASIRSNHQAAGVISAERSWDGGICAVQVDGRIDVWEIAGVIEEPSESDEGVKAEVPLWFRPEAVDDQLTISWEELVPYPQLATRLAYRKATPKGERHRYPLRFKVGDKFIASMEAAGVVAKAGWVQSTFHAASFIASGRTEQLRSLEAHPQRRSKGGNSRPVKRLDGSRLMRGAIRMGPDAQRLIWWEGAEPVLLGVVGHDEDPESLLC